MKKVPLILALSLGCCAATAFAEGEANTPFDPRWAQQEQQREAWINQQRAYANDPEYAIANGQVPRWGPNARGLSDRYECWNPHAGHFEGVRPGDRQDDLDFSRCRPKAGYYARPYGWR